MDYTPVATPEARAVARSLTLWYVLASTAIFLVAGLLGAALRQSQADIVRLGDNTFYAVMTAHGLGAFVGWAAFAVMGFAWWVLAEVGFPIGASRRPRWRARSGGSWSSASLGVVVTTLVFGFAGSWVFLYPLPFHSAGQWGDWVTAFFAASVLLVGLVDHRLVRRDHRGGDGARPRVGPLGPSTAWAPRWASASSGRSGSSARSRCPTRSSRSR